jgi:hypothetical protein
MMNSNKNLKPVLAYWRRIKATNDRFGVPACALVDLFFMMDGYAAVVPGPNGRILFLLRLLVLLWICFL